MTEDQAISRKRVEYALSHLPSLEKLETPPSVREAGWYKDAGLEDVVNVWAFPGHLTEKFSGKLPGVVGNFEHFEREGMFDNCPTLTMPSSGNFLKDGSGVARGHNVKKILGILPRGISDGKLKQIEADGMVTPMITPEGMSTVQYAYQLASETPNCIVMDQYINDATVVGHGRMMEHIGGEAKRLGWSDEGLLIGGITGTCATLTAMRRYLPNFVTGPVKIFAVASHSKKEKVPASRSPEDFEELRDINGSCGFMFREEWKGVLNFPMVTDVLRDEAFAMNGELFAYHYSVGPTGALLTAGLYRLLEQCHNDGTLKEMLEWLRNIVLVWMDSYYAYDDPYYRKFLAGQVG
jgi:hypothetical protein